MKNLENDSLFGEYYNSAEDNLLDMILHFTPDNIARTKEYKQFIQKFPPQTKHMFINERNKYANNNLENNELK